MTATAAERTGTSNEAALRFCLRAEGVANLPDFGALRRFAVDNPSAFQAAMLRYAGIAGSSTTLLVADRPPRLVLRRMDGLSDLNALLVHPWPAATLAAALAAVLLQADLRPDDRLLVAGLPPWPWLAALTQDIPVILATDATPQTLRDITVAEAATVIAAPPDWLHAAGLSTAPEAGPRGVYVTEDWPDPTAEPMPALPTRPGVVPKTVRNAAPKAGTLA